MLRSDFLLKSDFFFLRCCSHCHLNATAISLMCAGPSLGKCKMSSNVWGDGSFNWSKLMNKYHRTETIYIA